MTDQEETKLSSENKTKLREEIVACFNKNEIGILCDDLGINSELRRIVYQIENA